MGQQVKVYRDLKFMGSASHTGNIKGNFNPEKVIFGDHFTDRVLDIVYRWNSGGETGGTTGVAAITTPHMLTITTGGLDNDEWAVSSGLHYYGQNNAVLEVRARNDDVTHLAHNIGFSDATSESGTIAMTYDGSTLVSTALDYAGFMLDVDAAAYIYAVSAKSGVADGDIISSAHEEASASWATYRVELRDNGTTTDALFYLNIYGREIDPANDLIGIEPDAVTRTTKLCVYLAGMNRDETAQNTLDIDYVKTWQDVLIE